MTDGAQGLLVSLVEMKKEEKGLDSIPVVKEFPDVFPKELPSLPPEREIQFMIEVVSGTAPIFKAPYRIARQN